MEVLDDALNDVRDNHLKFVMRYVQPQRIEAGLDQVEHDRVLG